MHARTHTYSTSGRQLKITFLDFLDYAEDSDTNISKKKFSRKRSFLSEEAKTKITPILIQLFPFFIRNPLMDCSSHLDLVT